MRTGLLLVIIVASLCFSGCECMPPTKGDSPFAALYHEFGVEADGVWRLNGGELKLGEKIGPFEGGYVYTNKSNGVVYQFNLVKNYPQGVTFEHARNEVRMAQAWCCQHLGCETFTPHIDSNPNRYLYSEEAYLPKAPGWSVRFYVENGRQSGSLRASASVWNMRLRIPED